MEFDHPENSVWNLLNQPYYKFIRRHGFNVVGLQNVVRKVLQIECNDVFHFRMNGNGKDVPIVWIGQRERRHDWFVSVNKTVRKTNLHFSTCSFQFFPIQIRTIL